MILYSIIKTLILDYAIEAFFDKVSVSFSKFDLLGGSRDFKTLVFKDYYSDYHAKKYGLSNGDLIFNNIRLLNFREINERKYLINLKCLDKSNRVGSSISYGFMGYASRIVECIPGKLLIVEVL